MSESKQAGNIRGSVAKLSFYFLAATLLALLIYYLHSSRGMESQPEPAIRPAGQRTDRQPATSNPDTETVDTGSEKLTVTEMVSGLDVPWDIAFTPDDVLLVTERSGKLLARLADNSLQVVEADLSDLAVRGELGLMGLTVDPEFAANRRFYTCQGDRAAGQIQVIAWRMDDNYTRAERVDDPLVGGIPGANIHDGCRLSFGGEGFLWISTGDAAQGSHPQDLNSLGGKILRVDAITGRAAAGNPFDGSANAELVYTFGHRNPQGLAWRPELRQMWAVEHGPDVDDEINLLIKGGNYGWDPVSAANSYYQQVPMTDTAKYPDAIEARWSSGNPTLATAGATFLTGEWWGNKESWLAVATLKNSSLHLFQFDEAGNLKNRFLVPELNGTYGRLRTPIMGPDKALYLTTSNGGGNDFVLRVAPDMST